VAEAGLGYWLLVGIVVLTAWRISRPLYAIYLEEGLKWFFIVPLLPFILYFKFLRSWKQARKDWAEEVIEKHNNSRKTDTNS